MHSSTSATPRYAEGLHWHRALRVVAQISEAGLESDFIGKNAALSALGPASEWPRALQLFWQIASSKLVPDQVSCSSVIVACGVVVSGSFFSYTQVS